MSRTVRAFLRLPCVLGVLVIANVAQAAPPPLIADAPLAETPDGGAGADVPIPPPPISVPRAPLLRVPAFIEAAPGRGLTIQTDDRHYSLTIQPRIQVRDTYLYSANQGTNEFNIRTLRLTFSGNILVPELRYKVQLAFGAGDFEAGNPSPIYDAFLEYVALRDLNFRVGQFFVPFDRARTVREWALQFVDRSLAVRELSLDRDVGLMAFSDNFLGTHVLGYHFFVGGGDGKNRIGGKKRGLLAVARIVVRPWGTFDDDLEGDLGRLPRPRLAMGIAGGYNHGADRVGSTTGTFFTSGRVNYFHADVDIVFKYAGFSLLLEALLRRASQVDLPGAEFSRPANGYLAQAGYMVHRYVEVTARWDYLQPLSVTDPALRRLADTQGHIVVGGVNVYLNGHALKVQADYSYAYGASAGQHLARLQLDATF